jgi:hypothetical protein
MSIPNSRDAFKAYCLRKLGAEVIEINVSDNQVEDRIDEAIKFWTDFNVDATQRQFYAYHIQAEDITNQYITLPANIIGAVSIIPPGDAWNMANIFNIRYQIALNDLYTLTSVSMAPYYMAFSHIQLLEQLLVGLKPIRYNRISNILYLDMDWSIYTAGQMLVVDCYQVIDPATYPAMWGDRMLMRYTAALIKEQWGNNIKKFGNMQMPGGTILNGKEIYDEAISEKKEVEEKMIAEYGAGMSFEIG